MDTETPTLIGYARCSTVTQDLTAQREQLLALGVPEDRIYVDHGFTGTNRTRPGLDQALAALREGDHLVVTKLDRLGRSLKDLIAISETLQGRGVKLQVGSTVYDPNDPTSWLLFQVLGLVAEFEAGLIRQRTREGLQVARARGRLKGKQPKTTPAQDTLIASMLDSGDHSPAEVGALMGGLSRATVYRARERARARVSSSALPDAAPV